MKKIVNQEHLEGRVYEHDLSIKTVQNRESSNFGKSFISGTLNVAVDEEGLNVIPIHFTYVTEVTKSGNRNNTFTALKKIIDEGKAWITDGPDMATKVQIDTALALNDFYSQQDELVSLQVNEGGFVTIVNKICDEGTERHKFMVDMLITSARRITPEDHPEDMHVVLKGAAFNFRNAILPVEFIVRNPQGMMYFESLNVSSKTPVFTKVWGTINSVTKVTEKKDVSAFGEAAISYSEKKIKEWTVTGASQTPYLYGDENVLTEADVTKAMQDREVMLAETKKRRDEWKASQITSNSNAFASNMAMNATTVNTGFNF